jgi:hypothetical protein
MMNASVLIAFVALAAQIGNDALTSRSNDRATDPMNFVNVVTEAGIPAGLEIRESDVRRVGLQGKDGLGTRRQSRLSLSSS